MRRLKAASLVEAIVAAVVLMIVFAATMELLPRLSLCDDDGLRSVEAEYRMACALHKYGSGVWPEGEYVEPYDGGEVTIRVERYRDYGDLQRLRITVLIDGSRRRIEHEQVVECAE